MSRGRGRFRCGRTLFSGSEFEVLVDGFGQFPAEFHEPFGKGHFPVGEFSGIVFGAQVADGSCHTAIRLRNEPVLPVGELIEFRQRVGVGVRIDALGHEQGLGSGHHGAIGLVDGHGKLMFLGQNAGLVQFLLGFQDPIVDHLYGAAGTFTRAEIFERKFLFRFPVEVVRGILGIGWQNGMPDQFFLEGGLARSLDKGVQAFAFPAVPSIHVKQVRDRGRDVLGREFDRHLSDFRGPVDPPSKMKLIHRGNVVSDTFAYPVQPDGRDMMLGARIMTTADVDRGPFQIVGNLSRRKDFGQGAGDALG